MMEVDNVEKPTFKRRVAARLAPTKEVCQTIWATPGVAGKASALAKALELEPAKTTFSPGTKWSNPGTLILQHRAVSYHDRTRSS